MKTKLLQSREERWDELNLKVYSSPFLDAEYLVNNYQHFMDFLKQASQLYMFVPCDKEGNVLEKPECYQSKLLPVEVKAGGHVYGSYENYVEQYQQALDRVIFDGFEVAKGVYKNTYTNLLHCNYNLLANS